LIFNFCTTSWTWWIRSRWWNCWWIWIWNRSS